MDRTLSDGKLPDVLLSGHRRFLSFLEARVGDVGTAEDILQAAYVKALEGASAIRNEESVVAWFYRVLRNAVVDHYRRRAAEYRALEALGMETETTVAPEVRQQLCRCLKDVLGGVKESYRRAVEQVDLEEIPLPEFAREERISTANAAVRLHRARRAVAKELGKLCGACARHGCLDCGCRPAATENV